MFSYSKIVWHPCKGDLEAKHCARVLVFIRSKIMFKFPDNSVFEWISIYLNFRKERTRRRYIQNLDDISRNQGSLILICSQNFRNLNDQNARNSTILGFCGNLFIQFLYHILHLESSGVFHYGDSREKIRNSLVTMDWTLVTSVHPAFRPVSPCNLSCTHQ